MSDKSVLIIGNGGREHALAWKLAQSKHVGQIYSAPGNPGTAQLGRNLDIDVNDHNAIAEFAKERGIALVVVGPEQPLVDGIVDILQREKITVFGPDAYAAQLEGSKSFAKELMLKAGVPTASYKQFELSDLESIKDYIINYPDDKPLVLKADGLAGGKGVFVSSNKHRALLDLDEMISVKAIKSAASTLVIESFLEGEEASVFAICDGNDFVCLSSAQDHKRIGDGDKGLNTGGMGAYSPAPIVNEEVLELVKTDIIKPILKELKSQGHPYKGVLYCGLMIKDNQPSVVEFNCRFGDPECQVILPKLKSDLYELMLSASEGKLKSTNVQFDDSVYCSVVMASGGYPQSYAKGYKINGLDTDSNGLIFHSGTAHKDGDYLTNGGRVLNVVGSGVDLQEAINNSYSAVSKISFKDAYYRRDIGQKGLKY